MAHMTSVKRTVVRLGGRIVKESSGRWEVYQLEAPAGKVWAGSSTHVLRVEWLKGDDAYRIAAVTDALERTEEGLADCDDPDCDYCHPEENSDAP